MKKGKPAFVTSLAVILLNGPAPAILVTVFSTAAWNEVWKGYKDLKEREIKKSRQKNASEVRVLTLITGCTGSFSKPSLFSHGKEVQTRPPISGVAAVCPENSCGKLFWN